MKTRPKLLTFVIAAIFGAIVGLLALKLQSPDEQHFISYKTELKVVPSLSESGAFVDIIPSTDKYNVIHVINTWCKHCIEHIPDIQEISRVYPVIGLVWSNNSKEAQSWLKKYGNPYSEIGLLGDTDAISLGVHKTPVTLVIDKNGMVKCSFAGSLSLKKFDEIIAPCIE
jgi:cytochrome c biogenesis protein CcmG/thiol:disulfide interchange protein DsbE